VVADIDEDEIKGLRINGRRAIRARYPNADPEKGFGSSLKAKDYLPVKPDAPFIDYYPNSP